MENLEDYEQAQGLEAQLDYQDSDQEDPEIDQNITELQTEFHDEEMGVLDNPDDYAQTEGLDAQPDYQDFDENPEFNEPVTELQDTFHDQGMNVMDGMQQDTFNLDTQKPTAAAEDLPAEDAYQWDEEKEKGAAGQGFGA